MATRIADTFMTGLRVGGEMADRWERNTDNKRRRASEDKATEEQQMMSEAMLSVLGDTPSAVQEPVSQPAALPPGPGTEGALAVPGGASRPTPAVPPPNPAANAIPTMPKPVEKPPEAPPMNAYRRLQDAAMGMLKKGASMDSVIKFKATVSGELMKRARPHAARAVSALQRAKDASPEEAKVFQSIAAKSLEQAYQYLPDNGTAKVGIGPNGSLVAKGVDAEGKPTSGPPLILDAVGLETYMNQLMNPEAALAMATNAEARERAKADDKRKDRDSESKATTARASMVRAGAASKTANVASSTSAAKIEKLKAEADVAREKITTAKTTQEANRAQAELRKSQAKLAEARARLAGGTGNSDLDDLKTMIGGSATTAQIRAMGDLIKSRASSGRPLVDRVDMDGVAYIGNKAVPSTLAEKLRRQAATAQAAGKTAPFVDPEKDESQF